MSLRKREREAERDKEDASELSFGRDFEKEKCLMNSEALIMMKEVRAARQEEFGDDDFMQGFAGSLQLFFTFFF